LASDAAFFRRRYIVIRQASEQWNTGLATLRRAKNLPQPRASPKFNAVIKQSRPRRRPTRYGPEGSSATRYRPLVCRVETSTAVIQSDCGARIGMVRSLSKRCPRTPCEPRALSRRRLAAPIIRYSLEADVLRSYGMCQQPAVSGCNKMCSRSSRSFSDHVQTHPVVDRAARCAITTMAVRIKVMASTAMSLAV